MDAVSARTRGVFDGAPSHALEWFAEKKVATESVFFACLNYAHGKIVRGKEREYCKIDQRNLRDVNLMDPEEQILVAILGYIKFCHQ